MRWSIPKLALMLVIALGITASALHASTTTINSTLAAQNQPVTVQLPYYAELTYTDIINQTSSISLQPSQSSTVQAPLSPGPGYSLKYLEIYFPTPTPALTVSGAGVLVSQNQYGMITSAYTTNSSLVIVNNGQSTVNATIVISATFVKEEYIPLTPQTSTINITAPDYTFQYVTDQVVQLTIDNNAPFELVNAYLPNGTSLSQLVDNWYQNVTYFKIEEKALQLDMAKLPPGTYSVGIAYGSQYQMPSAMLVKGTQFFNSTVSPHSSLVVSSSSFGVPAGWNLLGYVAVVYTVEPLVVGENPVKFQVIANRVMPVYTLYNLISVAGITYILPPFIKFAPIIGIYVIYDNVFKVQNPTSSPLTVTYMPILYKQVGQWQNGNLVATVLPSDISNGLWTSLVVQLPEVASIEKIVTPSGVSYGGYTDSELPWGSVDRLVSISPTRHEAYIAVSTLGVSEPGQYEVYVNWSPLQVQLLNTNGNPVGGATVTATQDGVNYGPITVNSNGIAYIPIKSPDPVQFTVSYRGAPVYIGYVNTLTNQPITLQLGVYNVTVVVEGQFHQALSNVNVTLYRIGYGPTYSSITNGAGTSNVNGVLAGTYQVTAQLRYAKYTKVLPITNQGKPIIINTDILTVLDGMPITTGEALLTALGFGGAGMLLYAFTKGRKSKGGEGAEIENI
ncbi:hypothetical protein GCM10007981_16090 [Thermocladium modestius]|uniref:Carboxypeptidase regulatory-like domain-containing protein n=1 Tax=Thermocladium modestius TaxID=62609 RepID=A0A830GXR9_9CREN|nr:hypothetical protein [Thermocladium modestius]GGP21975.1 hypothetical protein GCM10007981_16090 [Thermocladium modestius]